MNCSCFGVILNNQSTPLISVVLPVYNGEKTIRKAILSILKQTYSNFELIIVNDGSVDSTRVIIESISDARINLINTSNFGLVSALNTGLSLSKGEIIARQDADDISHLRRFELQVLYLQKNNSIAVGSKANIVNKDQELIGKHDHPCDCRTISFALFYSNPIVHSSIMFKNIGLRYTNNSDLSPPEDYELWVRMLNKGKIWNIDAYLVEYSHLENSLSKNDFHLYFKRMREVSLQRMLLMKAKGLIPFNEECLKQLSAFLFFKFDEVELRLCHRYAFIFYRLAIISELPLRMFPKFMFRPFIYRLYKLLKYKII